MFNKFFVRKGQKDKITELAREAGKPSKFLLEVTVALSEYLCKLGLSDSVLSMKI